MGDAGGGIWDNGAFTFTDFNETRNNTVAGNTAGNAGGGVALRSRLGVVLGNLIVKNEAAFMGGGVMATGGRIENNTIVGNLTGSAFLNGAGIAVVESPIIAHNIVVDNHRAGLLGDASGVGIYCAPNAMPTVACNDIWGNDIDDIAPCTPTGSGNLSLDPEFCGAVYAA